MGLTFQLVVLLGLSSGLWMGADAKCPKPGDCCMTCPEGWLEYDARCFYFDANKKDWCDAEKACVNEGGNLASVKSAKELDFMRDLVVRFKGNMERTWLGGYDAVKEGCWGWSSGEKYDFNGWAKDEPNNDKNREHCMEMMHIEGQPINDAPCDVKKAFLCVRDLEKKMN